MPARRRLKGKPSQGHLWAVIMAGGSGTRFWPESRSRKPKQFLTIFGKKTLLEETLHRLRGVIPSSRVIVVTQRDQVRKVQRLLKLPRRQIIGEPVGRNTAPCAVVAAQIIRSKDPHGMLALLPADHRIEKVARFKKALHAAGAAARQIEAPVTFGIRPDHPHTGYGYLEMDRKADAVRGHSFFRVKRFHEKPDYAKAKTFLKTGKFLWNSGMFVWKADALLQTARKHLPGAYRLSQKIVAAGTERGMNRYFRKMPGVSIDYALMEKLKGGIWTLPVDIGWNDLGGWLSFETLWKKDGRGNVNLGRTLLVDSRDNVVKAGERLVVLLGVKNFVVVDTPDALLVCPKEQTESVKSVVQELKKRKWHRHL